MGANNSRTKTFFILMFYILCCLSIYAIPFHWAFAKTNPIFVVGLFVANLILQSWLIAPFVLLYGFIFVDKDYLFINLKYFTMITLKVGYVVIACLVYVYMCYHSLSLNQLLTNALPYYLLSGLTTMIIYEKFYSEKQD